MESILFWRANAKFSQFAIDSSPHYPSFTPSPRKSMNSLNLSPHISLLLWRESTRRSNIHKVEISLALNLIYASEWCIKLLRNRYLEKKRRRPREKISLILLRTKVEENVRWLWRHLTFSDILWYSLCWQYAIPSAFVFVFEWFLMLFG